LNQTSADKLLCDEEPLYFSDRPEDIKYNNTYKSIPKAEFKALLLDDSRPRCVKLLGYFLPIHLCKSAMRALWMPRMLKFSTVNPYGPNDIAVYLRCHPKHYHFHLVDYYRKVFQNTTHEKVWLFLSPVCPKKLDPNPARDGPVTSVIRYFLTDLNATIWNKHNADFSIEQLINEMVLLALAPKLVLCASTWALWAGLLSNASEIHVDPNHFRPMGPDYPEFIYHSERYDAYHGRYFLN
jgi:hypothetical protein